MNIGVAMGNETKEDAAFAKSEAGTPASAEGGMRGEKDNDSAKKPVVETENLKKFFPIGKEVYEAIRGISVKIYKGDFTIIFGPSGSGKSTLLNCILGLEPPTSGKVWIMNERLDLMNEDDRARLRGREIGVVYQQPIWVKALSVLENVALPLQIAGMDKYSACQKAKKSLEDVEMLKYADHKPTEISGGQQQRVSLARALTNDPKLLVLDEPTGNLDTHASDQVMRLLQNLNLSQKRTIIMVTHNLIYLPLANRTIHIVDGLASKVEAKKGQLLAKEGAKK